MAYRPLIAIACGLVVLVLPERLRADEPAVLIGLSLSEPEIPGEKYPPRSQLLRELARQSVLIAARDELGAATRDPALRETLPVASTGIYIFDLKSGQFRLGPIRFALHQHGQKEALSAGEFSERIPKSGGPLDVAKYVEALELRSRKEWLEALRGAGVKGQPNPKAKQLEIPADLKQQMRELNFISQYAAVRELHALHRIQGESAESLAALARCYANLGQLTYFHWNATNKVCRARAMLYAQRLLQAEGKTAWGYWNQAYVFALVGLPGDALQALELAHKVNSAAETREKPPIWIASIDAFCRFQYETLKEQAENEEIRELAAMLSFLAVENSKCEALTVTTGMQALRVNPENYAICESLGSHFQGVSNRHRTTVGGPLIFSRQLPVRLQELRNPPVGVRIAASEKTPSDKEEDPSWANPDQRKAIVAALVKSSDDALRHSEPSWEWLGRMIEDVTLIHAYRRIEFFNDELGFPLNQYEDQLRSAQAIVADHPYAAAVTVASLGFQGADAKQMERILEKMPFTDESTSLYDFSIRTCTANKDSKYVGSRLLTKIHSHSDEIAQDLEFFLLKKGSDKSQVLKQVSPFSPVATVLELTGRKLKPEALKRHEFLGARHANVMRALADQYVSVEDYAGAERCFEKYLKMSPDQAGFKKLAEVYLKQENRVKWQATLEQSLQFPDFGLAHARARVSIADYLMSEKKFQEALPYAEAAAESGAAWAMNCAASCYEGLEQWDKANDLLESSAHRYGGVAEQLWYSFCLRTGHGDREGAERLVVSTLPAKVKGGAAGDLELAGVVYLLSGKNALARTAFRRFYERHKVAWGGLFAAILADEAGSKKERDTILAELAAASTPEGYAPYFALARWMESDYKRPPSDKPDLAALDALLRPVETPEFLIQSYVISRYFKARKADELAQTYIDRGLKSPRTSKLFYAMLKELRNSTELDKPEPTLKITAE